ncbi:MAG TPA: hypothetical protein VFI56_12380 [Vicinamibacterales bacterium]|jgi:hypothetical protein|nr:hypothetical protein [Vicinamibacterales bacterium]
MVKRREAGAPGHSAGEQDVRDQEVLRANRELAAYFKGRRTEREARAALKIIKAFVRHRERQDARSRRPLPGTRATAAPAEKKKARAKPVRAAKRRLASVPRAPREISSPIDDSAAQKTSGDGPSE